MVNDITPTKYDLFSVPVVYYKNFLPLDIASNIKNYILEQKAKHATPHKNIMGDSLSYHSHTVNQQIIQELAVNVEGCSELENNVLACLNNYCTTTNFPNDLSIGSSWFNIQQPGSILTKHIHKDAAVAGALYINVDKSSSSIYFENPNPSFFYITEILRNFEINPDIGDLLLFPAWLVHYAGKINMTDNRIVLSINAITKNI
jgi:uncharacterized protein (TIGR02466 family)